MRRILVALVAAALAFAAVTLVALEGRGVAVLETSAADGTRHRTRVWFAEEGGALWIESAEPGRPFYRDLSDRPDLTVELHRSVFERRPEVVRAVAELVPEPGGHAKIRSLLEAKYGWADCWVAMLADTSDSRAVKISPKAAG